MINSLFKAIHLLLICLLCSCATILNTKHQYIYVKTSEPSTVIINGDSHQINQQKIPVIVPRSRNLLTINTLTDSSNKTVKVKPHNSFAYWYNIHANSGLGMLIDRNNPKRYSYPRNIYINTKESEKPYYRYIPLLPLADSLKHIIKIAPFKLISATNPGVELSYEKWTNKKFSTQFMVTYLFKNSIWNNGYFDHEHKGIRLSIEEKYYFRKNAPLDSYLSFEANYHNVNYNDIASFEFPKQVIQYDSLAYFPSSYQDTINIDKQTLSLNLKFGHQMVHNQFVLDLFVGLGVRYKNVIHHNKTHPEHRFTASRKFIDFSAFKNQPGKYWTISLPLNFRIGYVF